MKEIIHIHGGQAGVNMGEALWEKYCQQMNINKQGYINEAQGTVSPILQPQVLFAQNIKGSYTPRSIFIDLDPMPIEILQKSSKIFSSQHFIKGTQSSSSLYYDGVYKSLTLIDQCLDKIRKQVEKCSSFQGFVFQHSISGGTGSGLISILASRINIEFQKKQKIDFCLFPSQNMSNLVTEPYNAVLGLYQLNNNIDLMVPITNQRLYDIHTNQLDADQPFYYDINKTIAKICASVVVPICSDHSELSINLKGLTTNLIPYPRIHYTPASFAPFLPPDSQYIQRPSLSQITDSVFRKQNCTVDINYQNGKFMACQMFYRGNVLHGEALDALSYQRQKLKQVDWIKTGYKLSLLDVPLNQKCVSDKQVCLLSNNTEFKNIFGKIINKFDSMYAKRAFVHWYVGNCVGQGDFAVAREDINYIQRDFDQLNCDIVEQDDF